jgi:nucleotide-binding universal stress UspA family protein
MFQRILMAVDGSFHAEAAARYAGGIARASGADLWILHAVPPNESATVLKRAQASLLRIFTEAQTRGGTVSLVAESGDPTTVIPECAARERVDLVVLAVRGAGSHTVGPILPRLKMAALLVRVAHPGRLAVPREILLPIRGGSKTTVVRARATLAALLARAFDARVYVFHVRKPIARFFHGKVLLEPHDLESAAAREVQEYVEVLLEHAVRPATRVVHAPKIRQAITHEAAARRHDLILLGASERAGIRRLAGGSPVEAVLRDAPCDVMIFRPAR